MSKDSAEVVSSLLDVENTRVGILFKTLLRSTLNQLDLGYRLTMGMYVITFLLGVLLILAGLYMAFTAATNLLGILFTGVGGLDILLFFFSDPPAKLEKSRNNFAQLMAPYYAWHVEVVNRHNLLDEYRKDMLEPLGIVNPGILSKAASSTPLNTPTPSNTPLLSQSDRKKIWEEVFETERAQSRAILEDTSRFMEMMSSVWPLLSAIRSTTAHTITVTAGEGGSINPAGPVTVNDGANKTFTITPHEGYTIQEVKVDGESKGTISKHEFTAVSADHTIEATFSKKGKTHTITVTAGEGGTIDPSGPVSVADGASQAFTITAAEGYAIKEVKVDGTIEEKKPSQYEFTAVSADHTIEATFSKKGKTHTITVKAGDGGSIAPSGPVTVEDGASQAFTITAAEGYAIKEVKVDGTKEEKKPSQYEFTAVSADHTIEATFSKQ